MQTDRLNMIIKHIHARTVADIGTDHGYIPAELVRRGVSRVIATDLRPGPLEAARRRIAISGGGDKIELRMGDGLSPIEPGECENIIIAGMGGELICKILSEGEKVAKAADKLLLQPMNSQDMLRKYLSENGYEIISEDIECEGFKVYNLICVKQGTGYPYRDELDLHIPEYLRTHDKFSALVRKKQREFSKILSGLESARQRDDDQIERYKTLLKGTEELL